jgi:hypothetical protein
MQREQRRDPRHLPNAEEIRKTTEPLKKHSTKTPLDSATQVERKGTKKPSPRGEGSDIASY